MHRFYIPTSLPTGSLENLPDTVTHHIRKVLRLRDGETIGLWNGDGCLRTAELRLEARGATALITGTSTPMPPPPLHITLIQALPEADKMDWIIEKACETGVSEIRPVQARRSVVKLDAERMAKRLAHWERVAIAACSQCGRTRLPAIHRPASAEAAFSQSRSDQPAALPWLLSPAASQSACESLLAHLRQDSGDGGKNPSDTPPGLALAIGPEGGWDDAELRLATEHGFVPVSLGTFVLRTETAGLFASAQALAWEQALRLSGPLAARPGR